MSFLAPLQSCLKPELNVEKEVKAEEKPKLKRPVHSNLAEVKIIEKKLQEPSKELNQEKSKVSKAINLNQSEKAARTFEKYGDKKTHEEKTDLYPNSLRKRDTQSIQSSPIKLDKSAIRKEDSQNVNAEQASTKSQGSSGSGLSNFKNEDSSKDNSQPLYEMGGHNVYKKGFEPDKPNIRPKEDDIIARQLRDAAISETDPKLKSKLWSEYERYRSNL